MRSWARHSVPCQNYNSSLPCLLHEQRFLTGNVCNPRQSARVREQPPLVIQESYFEDHPDFLNQWRLACAKLTQKRLHHFARDIGETIIAALEPEGQPFVVEPEQVKDGGLEIVDVDFVLRHAETEFI